MRNVTLQSEFIPLTIEGLPALAAEKKAEGARFVQMLCVNTEEGIDHPTFILSSAPRYGK